MKLPIVKISALLALMFFMASCQKETFETDDTEASQSAVNAEGLMEDLDSEVAYKTSSSSTTTTTCAAITYANPAGTYPNTITIDYGSTGCVGPYGNVRKGQILIEVSAPYYDPGAVRSITPVNYSVNDWSVEGSRVVTNLGEDSNGHLHWSVEVTGAQITDPSGQAATWTASRIRTLVEGAESEGIEDDVYEITGGSSGVGRAGQQFTATIMVPLVKPMDCKWIVSGVREVVVERDGRPNRTRSLDFGTGDCDDQATLTLANGNQVQITLRR